MKLRHKIMKLVNIQSTVKQWLATFCTSGPHTVLTRFQRAATVPVDQKRKVFDRNSGLFAARLMVKTKK